MSLVVGLLRNSGIQTLGPWRTLALVSSTTGVDRLIRGTADTMNQPNPVTIRTQKILCELSGLLGPSNSLQAHCDSVQGNGHSLLNWAVDSAIRVTNATKGNLQVFDPASVALQIVAHRGFNQPFLDFFKQVNGDESACAKAFGTRQRITVEDVTESPIFYGTAALEVLLDARVRAVQSTPLISSSGAILGVLSTHWPSPRRLSNDGFVKLDVLARTVARWLEHNS